jgi:hypothetical protein
MRHAKRLIIVGIAAFALQGCLAKTAIDTAVGVASLPVKVASRGVDLATTSQSEADQKRGREIRQREERLGKLQRDYDKQSGRCQNGDREACGKAEQIQAEMRQIMPSLPVEPEQAD